MDWIMCLIQLYLIKISKVLGIFNKYPIIDLLFLRYPYAIQFLFSQSLKSYFKFHLLAFAP